MPREKSYKDFSMARAWVCQLGSQLFPSKHQQLGPKKLFPSSAGIEGGNKQKNKSKKRAILPAAVS